MGSALVLLKGSSAADSLYLQVCAKREEFSASGVKGSKWLDKQPSGAKQAAEKHKYLGGIGGRHPAGAEVRVDLK